MRARRATRRGGTIKVRVKRPGEQAGKSRSNAPRPAGTTHIPETFHPAHCLVCTDPEHYSGCVGCGKVIPRRAGWCSTDCMNSDVIGAPRAPQRSEAQTWE